MTTEHSLEDFVEADKSAKESPHNDILSPCPLCGRKVRIHARLDLLFHVYCQRCRLASMHKRSTYHAAMQWNRLVNLILARISHE